MLECTSVSGRIPCPTTILRAHYQRNWFHVPRLKLALRPGHSDQHASWEPRRHKFGSLPARLYHHQMALGSSPALRIGCLRRRALFGATVLVRCLRASMLDSNNAKTNIAKPIVNTRLRTRVRRTSEFSHSSNQVKYVVQFVTFSGFSLSFQVQVWSLPPFASSTIHFGQPGTPSEP